MNRSVLITAATALVLLSACSQSQTSSQPSASPMATTAMPEPSMSEPSTGAASPDNTATGSAVPSQSVTAPPSDKAFCNYLKKTQGAQQLVEDPDQYVALVQGAAQLAPGSIAEDAALYAESARQLALTVTGDAKESAKADKWLNANQGAIDQAEANLNSYAESTCGVPFISGEQ